MGNWSSSLDLDSCLAGVSFGNWCLLSTGMMGPWVWWRSGTWNLGAGGGRPAVRVMETLLGLGGSSIVLVSFSASSLSEVTFAFATSSACSILLSDLRLELPF